MRSVEPVSRTTTRCGSPGTSTGPFAAFTVTGGSGVGEGDPLASKPSGVGGCEPPEEGVHAVSAAPPRPARNVRRAIRGIGGSSGDAATGQGRVDYVRNQT